LQKAGVTVACQDTTDKALAMEKIARHAIEQELWASQESNAALNQELQAIRDSNAALNEDLRIARDSDDAAQQELASKATIFDELATQE
jgi:hypothetical protein